MKSFFFFSFLCIGLLTNNIIYAQCDWQDLGPSDTNTVRNEAVSFSDMALDNNDHPYTVFSDGDKSGKITVRKFNSAIWSTTGTAGFSTGIASYNSIDIDNSDTPYVAYCDYGNGDKATVKKFDGTDWIQVGSVLSTGSAAYTSLFIDDNNIPFVAFKDNANGNKITVKKFDGTNWILVGSAGFSSGIANYVSLVVDNTGTPFVTYQDGGNGNKASVKKFDGSTWITIGLEGFTTGSSSYTKVAVNSSGEPSVVFSDEDNGDKITVMEYDGTNWVLVGSVQGQGKYSSITFDGNDVLFVTYRNDYNGKIIVIKFKQSLNHWSTVGNRDFSEGNEQVCIQIGSGGMAYISFRTNYALTTWKCLNNSWEMLGVPEFSAEKTSTANHLVISKTGIPYVVYGDKTRSNAVVVNRYVGNNWEPVGDIVGSGSSGNYSFSIALDTNDVPHVIYRNSAGYINVDKYDGSSWVDMPNPKVGSSNVKGDDCDITFNRKTNVAYISYRVLNSSYPSSYEKLEIKKFDESIQAWTMDYGAGDVALVPSGGASIAIDTNDIVYVAFANQSNRTVVVRKLTLNNNSWWTWSNVGSTYTIGPNRAATIDLAISPDNVPYIVYEDITAGNQIVVKKFDGVDWVVVGTEGFSAGKAYNTAITIDAGGTPYVSFGDDANDGKITVMKFDDTNWETVGSTGFSGEKVVSLVL